MALEAHLEPVGGQREARADARRNLRLETEGVLSSGREANVTIHNLSAAGLLLETGLDLPTGEVLTINLPQAGAVEAVIMWRSDRLYGCAFGTALGAAALAAAQLQGLPVGEAASAAPPAPSPGAGETLGARLGRLRREAGLTLAEVAARLGVSKPTVWAWEKGKARPLPERTEAIAEALGVAPDQIATAAGSSADLGAVVEDCRSRIADACGAAPAAVRIMIEL